MVRGVRTGLTGVAIGLSAALVAVTAAIAAAMPAKVGVAPAKGASQAAFTVHFIAPNASGTANGHDYAYIVSASLQGPGTTTCEQSVRVAPTITVARRTVKVMLRPHSGGWCAGTYTGSVLETVRMNCGPPVMTGNPGTRDGLNASIALTTRTTRTSRTAKAAETATTAATARSFMCPMYIMSVPLGSFRFTVSG